MRSYRCVLPGYLILMYLVIISEFTWTEFPTLYFLILGFPDVSDGKESTCNAGDLGSVSELGRYSGGGNGNPLQYSCLENPHGQRSLVGYSPWGCKESDTTEWLRTHTHTFSLLRAILTILDPLFLHIHFRICLIYYTKFYKNKILVRDWIKILIAIELMDQFVKN